MSTTTTAPSTGSDAAQSAPRSHPSEFLFVGACYITTMVVGSLFVSACGPGCCFVLYSVCAAVSGLLMLRRRLATRIVCLLALFFSLFGMWHEKETRDTWGQRALRLQIQNLQKQIEEVHPK